LKNNFQSYCLRALPWIISILPLIETTGQEIILEREAESGIILGSAEIVSTCTNASGGSFVRLNSEPGNSLIIDSISIQDSGTYRMKIHYFYQGENPVEIWVNGDSLGVYYLPASTWCYQGPPAVFAIDIYLNEGYNSVKFRTYNNKNAPFIDRVSVQMTGKVETNLRSTADRILPGQSTLILVEIQDVSPKDETIEISVPGLDPTAYSLSDSILIIPSGKENQHLQHSIIQVNQQVRIL